MPKKREWTEGERGQVVALRKAGKSYKEIQQLTGIPITTSYDIVQKATTTGSVVNQPRSGRPSIFSPTVQNQIHQVIKAQPDITAKEITTKLVKKFGTRYSSSESSVRKKRVELGYTKGKGLGQDSLTADQKKQRLQYCKQHLKDQFSNVVFSDEKPWVVGKKRRSLWRKHGGARPVYWKTKYTIKIQCWGGISFSGKTRLRIWTGRQPSQHYVDTLDKYLLPFADAHMPKRWRFQQDRDTTHTSKLTKSWLEEKNIFTFETPAKSPDLAPIEKIWNILEIRVYRHNPKTVEELKKWIRFEWSRLEQRLIDKTIFSMMKNIPLTIAAKGEYVEAKRGYRH